MNPPTAAPSSEILLNLAYLSSTLKSAGHEVLVIDGTTPFNKMTEEDAFNLSEEILSCSLSTALLTAFFVSLCRRGSKDLGDHAGPPLRK